MSRIFDTIYSMDQLPFFYALTLAIQIFHSIEELTTGFHKKWYLFKMSFRNFLIFEMLFNSFWIFVLILQSFPYRSFIQALFLILMFANGIQHIVWAGSVKKYVPGLITGVIHVFLFVFFFFMFLF